MVLLMKNLLILISLFLLTCNVSFAASITEELTQLNNLFKEGAITKEEFSKAKSILLKTETLIQPIEKKKKSEKIVKEKKKKEIKKQEIVKKNINEDLTKSYMHIDEIEELGNFEIITEAPEGMFKTKGESFAQRAKNASQNMYLVFVQQKNLMEKNPENLMKAMGHFEFFYMEQLRKKKKNLAKFKEKWPDIPSYIKKDIKSLYSLNQARKSMRESMGLTLEDDVQDALKRYMLMHDFLGQAKKETIKLSSKEKKLRKNSKKLNTSLSNLEKNIKLRKEQRITEKEFKKNISKDIKKSKQALKLLSKDPDNMDFYKNIDKVFVDIIESNSDLDLSLDSLKFVSGIIKDIEKDIIPKRYIQNMDSISVEGMPEDDQKILASVSLSMKLQKKEKKNLLQNSILNLSNNGINVDEYVDQIKKSGFDLKTVTMTFDDFDNMKRWASKDWAKSWKGELPAEVKDIDGNIIEFTDENIQDLKAQLAINTFNGMIDIDQIQLESSLNDSIKEIAQEIQSSGGFNIDDYLNQDFSITLNNYSQLVGNAVGIDINDFKDLTRYANEIYGSDMKVEDYANHWQTSQYMDSTSNWGDVTLGVDLIDQVGSFDAASIAQSLGADLQTVADSIAQAATVGVSTDLEAAAQGLGYGSFADAVAAYNKQYGTSYTTESAKEALGQ
jgi:hypothetical protein